MNKKLKLFLIVNVMVASLLVILSCGGGGGGIIPPIGGGGGGGGSGGGGGGGSGNTIQSSINSTEGAWIIFTTKSNSINSSEYALQFSSANPNILQNQNNNPIQRETLNQNHFRCGFIPSQKDPNQNIFYSLTRPTVGEQRNFVTYGYPPHTATCRYVNDNPDFAVWVSSSDWNFSITQDDVDQFATRFKTAYNTLTSRLNYTPPFYVDILITSHMQSNILGYFWAYEDLQRININVIAFNFDYGTYTEADATVAHEFTHLLSYHSSPVGNKDSWIEEGIATYAEELCGYFNPNPNSNEVRMNSIRRFFINPYTTPLVASSVEFENYGKSFLFVKFLDQRFNNAWGRIVESPISNGVQIVENINGQEDFYTTLEIFNIALILDVNNNIHFGFNNLDLNQIDRNPNNSISSDKGIYKFDESDNDGFENKNLSQMGAYSNIEKYSSFYIYKTNNPFNGVVKFIVPLWINFNRINSNVAPFNTLTGYNFDRIDDQGNTIRITVVYR